MLTRSRKHPAKKSQTAPLSPAAPLLKTGSPKPCQSSEGSIHDVNSCDRTCMHAHTSSYIYITVCNCVHACIHSFTHSFTHSFFHTFFHSLTHSFIRSSILSFTHSYVHTYMITYTQAKPAGLQESARHIPLRRLLTTEA